MGNRTDSRRYYLLKLHDDFFSRLRIKKLRRAEGGEILTLIYLKLLLKAIKSDGTLTFSGVEPDLASELALDLDEDETAVRRALELLGSSGLAEISAEGLYLPDAVACTGCETSAAQRMREKRRSSASAEPSEAAGAPAAVTRGEHCSPSPEQRSVETDIRDRDKIKETEERDKRKATEEREIVFTGEETSPSSARTPADSGVLSLVSVAAPPPGRAVKSGYGEYGNVLLTEEEFGRVKREFPTDWRARIDGLSAYVASTGKAYKSHFATIRNWARMERERGQPRAAKERGDNVFLAIAKEEGVI